MFILPYILVIGLLCLPSKTIAECCRPLPISFQLAKTNSLLNCEMFGGTLDINYSCKSRICGDGMNVWGAWCGQGACNPRGCSCLNGCIEGDPIMNFRLKHGLENFVHVGPQLENYM
ncbi:protein Diedel-like [Drosophila miranda]|uniref:protein Diedel-like n=1 Tax=Drosophila miranda TaxID=7229 RepID=UPI0007E80FA5|nr:protein Diedel-like [Drosophila miranda]